MNKFFNQNKKAVITAILLIIALSIYFFMQFKAKKEALQLRALTLYERSKGWHNINLAIYEKYKSYSETTLTEWDKEEGGEFFDKLRAFKAGETYTEQAEARGQTIVEFIAKGAKWYALQTLLKEGNTEDSINKILLDL